MALYLSIVKAILEVALLALAGQGLVGAFNWNGRHRNAVYQLLGIVARPFVVMVRRITPAVVLDQHIPLATFLVLLFTWLGVGMWKISACHTDPGQPTCREFARAQEHAP